MRHDAVTSDGPGRRGGSSHEEGVMAFDQSFPGHPTKKNETNTKNELVAELYRKHAADLVAFAAHALGDANGDAEDIVHDAMVVLLELQLMPANPAQYLRGIVRRNCMTSPRDRAASPADTRRLHDLVR
jgi:DNA-directed RNA polymerase specialized sigma24 family protein